MGLRANFYAHGADGVTAMRKALAAIYGMVQQHAAMLAFVEAFWIMGVVFLLMLPFLPLLQYSRPVRALKVSTPRRNLSPVRIPRPSPERVEEVPEEEAEIHHLVLH
jgi:hypothetical protein